jgi:hypothetical protein
MVPCAQKAANYAKFYSENNLRLTRDMAIFESLTQKWNVKRRRKGEFSACENKNHLFRDRPL